MMSIRVWLTIFTFYQCFLGENVCKANNRLHNNCSKMLASEKYSFPRKLMENYNENTASLIRSLENLPERNTKGDCQRSYKVQRHCNKNKRNVNKFLLNNDVTKLNFYNENSINENIFNPQLKDISVNNSQTKMINLKFMNNDEQDTKHKEQEKQLMNKEINMANMKANEIKKAKRLVHKIIFKKKNPVVKIILPQNNVTENANNELGTDINCKNEFKGNKKYAQTLPRFYNKLRNFPVSPDPLKNYDSKSLRDFKTKPDDKGWYINFLNCNISIMNSSLNAMHTRIYTTNSHWWNPTTNMLASNIQNRMYDDQLWNYTTWHQTYRTYMNEKPSINVSTPFNRQEKPGNVSALSESNYILFNNSAQVILNFWDRNALTNINQSNTYPPKYSISKISENTEDMHQQMNDNIEIKVTLPELIKKNLKDNNSSIFNTKFIQENYTTNMTDHNKLAEMNGLKYTKIEILNLPKNNNSKSCAGNDNTAESDSFSNFIQIPKSMKNVYYDNDKPNIEKYQLKYSNARHDFFNNRESLQNNHFNNNEQLHTTESKTFPPLFVHHSKKDYYHYILKPNQINSHSINKITLHNQQGTTLSQNTVVGPSSLALTAKTKSDNNTLPKKLSKTKNFWSLLNSFNRNENDRTGSETRSESQKNKLKTTQSSEFHYENKSLKTLDSTKFNNGTTSSHDNMNNTKYFRHNEKNAYMDKNEYDASKTFTPTAKVEEFKNGMRSSLNRLKSSPLELRLPNEYNVNPFIDVKEGDDDYEDDENINTETNTVSKEAENFKFLDFIDKSIHSLEKIIENNNRSNDNKILFKSFETHKATENYLNDTNNFDNEKVRPVEN